jgi:GMP synthase (glutamine-hydrolysing)
VGWQDAGVLKPALERRGFGVRYVEALTTDQLNVQVRADDLLIVLGGPNGAYDETHYPRLAQELRLIERWLKDKRPLLGICLGAQLMARVLGAQVRTMDRPEVAVGPLTLTDAGQASALKDRAAAAPVLYWHQDTFDIPHGAVHLARSPRCDSQAFSYQNHALALQFHLEPDPERFEEWLVGNSHQLARAGLDARQLRADMAVNAQAFSNAGHAFVDAWLHSIEQ